MGIAVPTKVVEMLVVVGSALPTKVVGMQASNQIQESKWSNFHLVDCQINFMQTWQQSSHGEELDQCWAESNYHTTLFFSQ